jgi:spore coat polysaccharide biosynthesis protein SpsF
MKVVAFIQARVGSTRLPGKVLKDIAGQTMLERVVSRTERAKLLDKVVVATTTEQADDLIDSLCRKRDWPCFRGSQNDVLDRYYQASLAHQVEVVVRITADCPLIDPGVIDQVVSAFLEEKPDYASNTLERTYPRGQDTEVMTQSALGRAWRDAREFYQREHVTPYIYQDPSSFRLLSVASEVDYSHYRWTVDTPEDLSFVRAVYDRMGTRENFTFRDVLTLLMREPALVEVNRYVRQKSLTES